MDVVVKLFGGCLLAAIVILVVLTVVVNVGSAVFGCNCDLDDDEKKED